MRKGIAVSPGVAVGTAYCIHDIFVNPDTKRLEPHQVTAELAAFESARDKTAKDLRALQNKVESQLGRDEAAIFAVHEGILRDHDFTEKIRSWIADERLTAAAALHQLLEHYTVLFTRTHDSYFKERLNDLRDVVVRISGHLSEVVQPDSKALQGPLIVVADELLPSHVVALEETTIGGFVTQTGSRTSHAAIIARSQGIPAVSGVGGILRQVHTGDTLIVDGRDGHVIINPDPEARSAYRKLEREFFHLRDQLAENRDQPARTADGVDLELQANINNVSETRASAAMGASGVGLFRTEYIFLTHPSIPDEQEQYETFCQIIDACPAQTVTIRTLDIGGDKTVPYLGHHRREANPFLGWRSIRLSFEHPEFFNTQIRAIMRSASYARDHGGSVHMMFPMITTLEEIHRLRRMVRKVCDQLKKEHKGFCEIPMGMMLEVPAAAVSIRSMLPVIDFVSIGSNDLIQYLMAADRDNPKVSHLCQPLAPAVLRVLSDVIQACNDATKPVTLCGEMAGDATCFVLLLGMGLRKFSMSPAFIPTVKDVAQRLTIDQARTILEHTLRLKTVGQVKRYLHEQMKAISPNVDLMESV
jgi:phosphotransferase system enzyme I (PtsI)